MLRSVQQVFSQGSLQDFVDCQRRYELRYRLNVAWPAIESDPILEQERLKRQGALFHRMIQQYFSGIHPDRLLSLIHDPDLRHWWESFIAWIDESPNSQKFSQAARRVPEIGLTASLAGFRLLAKCDLLLVESTGKISLFDWKTARQVPNRNWLAERLQTRLYPYLLARAGDHMNLGCEITPERIEMVYWFANFPDRPVKFEYNNRQYQADEIYLSGLLERIQSLKPGEFQLTADAERCRFCVYRSLCDRGVEAGSTAQDLVEQGITDLSDFEIDFDQINAIEY